MATSLANSRVKASSYTPQIGCLSEIFTVAAGASFLTLTIASRAARSVVKPSPASVDLLVAIANAPANVAVLPTAEPEDNHPYSLFDLTMSNSLV